MRKIALISNDISFAQTFEEICKEYSESVKCFLHSDLESERIPLLDLKRKSLIIKHLANVDVVIPLVTGLSGIYLLQNVLTSLFDSDVLFVRVNTILSKYAGYDNPLFRDELSLRKVFYYYSPNAFVFNYLLLESRIPEFLKGTMLLKSLKDFVVSPVDFLSTVIERLNASESFANEGLIVSSLPKPEKVSKFKKTIEEKYSKNLLLNKVNSLLRSKSAQLQDFYSALLKFLNDYSSGKIANIVPVKEKVVEVYV